MTEKNRSLEGLYGEISDKDLLIDYLKKLFSYKIVKEPSDTFRRPDRSIEVDEEPIDWTKSLDTAIYEVLNYRSKFNKYGQLIELNLNALGILKLPDCALPCTFLENFYLNGYFNKIPNDIFNKLSCLQVIQISSKRDLEVSNKVFENCKQLKRISLSSSNRLIIDNINFSYNKDLESLSLKISIEELLNDLTNLDSLKTLKYVDLRVDSKMCSLDSLVEFIPKLNFLSNLNIVFESFYEEPLEIDQTAEDQRKIHDLIIENMHLANSIEKKYSDSFDVLRLKIENVNSRSPLDDWNLNEKIQLTE